MSTELERQIMAKNIKRYMDIKNVTRPQICEELNIKYTTFTDWINATTYPRMGKIERMANYFGCEKSDLIEERSINHQTKAHRIPVYGEVAAGIPLDMIEDIIDYEEIPAKWGDPSDFFCLKIRGNSMEPRIVDGDVVVVRKQADADTGDIVIYSVNGDSAACKRLRKTEDGLMFIPFNNEYFPKAYNWEEVESLPVCILGRVIELRGKL